MSYFYFIACLTGYMVLVVASFFIPSENANIRLKEKLGQEKKAKLIAIALFNIVLVVIAVIGFIGLFLLWLPATYLFFGAISVRIINDYVFGDELSMRGVGGRFANLILFVEFLLAWLCFFGPAKSLFHA